MNTFAIISEFNPFHSGHKLLIDKSRENGATHIVAIMSGSFMQRGEISIFSKFARTECALQNGVDLVIELPTIFSNSSAKTFAYGGVNILNSTNCIDFLAFGSECGDISALNKVLDIMSCEKYISDLKHHLSLGKSYARACSDAISNICIDSNKVLSSANNTLAIEYISALRHYKSKIQPITFERVGAMHDSFKTYKNIASASNIRNRILNKEEFLNFIPENCYEILNKEIEKGRISNKNNIETAIIYKLRCMDLNDFKNLPDVSEGLENRLHKAVLEHTNLCDIIEQVKTKRYTHARIRRIIMCAFLDIKKDMYSSFTPFVRVLGFNKNGIEVLRKIKDNSNIKIITKISNNFNELSESQKAILNLDIKACDIQGLSFEVPQKCREDFYIGNIHLK